MPVSPNEVALLGERELGNFLLGDPVLTAETILSESLVSYSGEAVLLTAQDESFWFEEVAETSDCQYSWQEVAETSTTEDLDWEEVVETSSATPGYLDVVTGTAGLDDPEAVTTKVEIELDGVTRRLDDQADFGVALLAVDRPIDAAGTFEITLDDEEWKLDPATPGTWQHWIRPGVKPSGGRFRKIVRLYATISGAETLLMSGPILGRRTGASRSKPQPQQGLRGTDMGRLLMKRNVSLQSYTSTYSAPVTNHRILTDIANLVGLGIDYSQLPEMVVPQFHFQAQSPLAAVGRIVESSGGQWRIDGQVLRCFEPRVLPKEQAVRTFELGTGIAEELDVDESTAEIANVITVRRMEIASDQVATLSKRNATFGRYNAPFSTPIAPGTFRPDIRHILDGVLSDYWLLDEGGGVVLVVGTRGNESPPTTGSGPAASVEFTFGIPDFNPLISSGDFDVVFFGKPFGDLGNFEGSGPAAKEFRYQESIDEDDELREEIFDPLLPDLESMRRRADRRHYGGLGLKLRRVLKAPFDPDLLPGYTVRLQIPDTEEDLALYIRHAVHQYAPDPANRFSVYELVPFV